MAKAQHTTTQNSGYRSPLKAKSNASGAAPRGNQTFLFDKRNYMWMGIGLACILIGLLLMSGGKSTDPHQFDYKEIYSFRRITLAPIIILIGFGIEAYAIMLKRKPDAEQKNESSTSE